MAKLVQAVHDVVELPFRKPRINSEKKSIVHHTVGPVYVASRAKGSRVVIFKINKCWLTDKISTKKHAVANTAFVEMPCQLCAGKRRARFNQKQESEPRRIRGMPAVVPSKTLFTPSDGVGRQLEVEILTKISERGAQELPIGSAGFNEGRKLAHLHTPDGGLGIQGLQIVAKVAVDVFVVITLG